MGKQFFYASGETNDAALREAEGYPECRFSYTPLTSGEHAEATGGLAKSDCPGAAKMAMRLIRIHVKSWNVVKADGTAVEPKNEGEVNRLVPQLSTDIAEVMLKSSQGDLPALEKEAAEDVAPGGAEGGDEAGADPAEDERGN